MMEIEEEADPAEDFHNNQQKVAKSQSSLLHNSAYRWWFTSDTAAAIGLSAKGLVVPLVGFALSGSLAAAGMLGTVSLVLQQVCAIFGGTVIDRHKRGRLVALNAMIGMAGYGTIAVLLGTSRLNFSMFAIVVCVLASANGLLGKATDAMLRSIVEQSRYAEARSVNEGRDATIAVAGSPLGGLLYGFTPWLPFIVMAGCFLLSGITIVPASRACQEDGTQEQPSGQSFWQDFKEGWLWVLHQRTLLLLVAVACLMNFASSGMQYCVQMQLINEGVSALRIGYVDTATGVILIIGSLIATRLSKTAKVGQALVVLHCAATECAWYQCCGRNLTFSCCLAQLSHSLCFHCSMRWQWDSSLARHQLICRDEYPQL